MKKLFLLVILITTTIQAQQGLFRFYEPEEYNVDLSFAISVDPVASHKEGGLHIGAELEAQFKPVYLRPYVINFAALKDGYTEFGLGAGFNFSIGNLDKIRYYIGARGGFIWRASPVPYATGGPEIGINFLPFNSKYYFGARFYYVCRSDSEYYDGELWEYNGNLVIGVKLN